MVEPHVTLDPASLDGVETKLRGPLEDQLTSALQVAAEKVEAEYAGEPVGAVTTRLLAETRHGLHPDIAAGWTPDMAELQRVAQAIVRQRS